MNEHNDRVSMQQMLDHALEAVVMIKEKQRNNLETNRMLQLALVRLVEIIGEAAARVSSQTRENYPQVPWRQIIGTRNRLIHGYDLMDFDILWDTTTVDLPELIQTLENILKREKS